MGGIFCAIGMLRVRLAMSCMLVLATLLTMCYITMVTPEPRHAFAPRSSHWTAGRSSASPAPLPRTTCLDPAHPCPGSFQYIPPLPSINQSLSTPALPFTLPSFSQSDIDSCKQQWDAIKVQTKNRQNPKSSHREDLTIFERYF